MGLPWPLTGRSDELLTIGAALADPDVKGVLVSGEQGVGKSRIAREAMSVAASHGSATRWTVGSTSAREIPLGAFSAWVPSGVTDTVGLVRGVVETLTEAPPGTSVVLGVDDAHLLDDLSTFVVHQIVQRGLAKVILTVRDGEPIPPAVREVWTVARFGRLDLEALSCADTASLLAATLGAEVTAETAERMWTLTRGNALYLRHIVEHEVAERRIVRDGGRWCWTGVPGMAPGLVELVEARIGELAAPLDDVIDVVAVAEPIDLAALQRLTAADAVEEADARGLITLESAGTGIEVRMAHPLYAEVRRRRAPLTRLRRFRGMVADAFASSPDSDDIRVVVRRAALSIDSDVTPDADLLVAAARGAVWLADLALADRLADAAVRAGGGPEPIFLRAHALSWLGRGPEAENVLADVRVGELTEAQRGRLGFLRASNLLWELGDPVAAERVIDGLADIEPGIGRAHRDAFLAILWFATDQPARALQASEDLQLQDIPVVGTEVAWTLAQIRGDAGNTTEARRVAAAGYDAATRSLDAPHMRFNIADAELTALVLAGNVDDAQEVADRMRAEAANLPGAAQLLGVALTGRAALSRGDLDPACRHLQEAADGLSVSHAGGWGFRYRVAQVTALAMRGSTDAAAAALRGLDGVRRAFRRLDFERTTAAAWVAASQGAVSEAVAMLLGGAERSREAGRFAEEVVALQTAAQFGDRSGAARLDELAALVEGPRAGVAARFAAALVDADGAALAAVSEEFEGIGDLVAAVDAAAHAAIAYRRLDKRGSALTCSTRADALAARGGIVTPALRQASEALPLTDREVEIVMLIGAGLSNRAIAQRLTLSVRTVESHIYRAMSKTGTESRDEVAALLCRRNP